MTTTRAALLVVFFTACNNSGAIGGQDMSATADMAVASDLPQPDQAQAPLCTDADLDDGGIEASLEVVQQLLDRYCTSCHVAGRGIA